MPTGDGLTGTYHDNKDFTGPTVTRIDGPIDFDWGKGSPVPGIAADTFSVRWTGQVQPQFTEEVKAFLREHARAAKAETAGAATDG